jgi:hypothetical protein
MKQALLTFALRFLFWLLGPRRAIGLLTMLGIVEVKLDIQPCTPEQHSQEHA